MTTLDLPPVFESLGFLYGPADPTRPAHIVEADDRWQLPPPPPTGVEVLLWGRLARNQRPTPGSVVGAIRREVALARLRIRPPAGLHIADVHRLPPVHRPGRIRRRIRRAVLGGVMVELVGRDRPTRVIDEVVAAAGAPSLGPGLRPSGDGSALARLRLGDGSAAELRVSRIGHPKDPHRGHAALVALEAAGIALVPRPLTEGSTAGANWTTESVVAGGHASRLTPELIRDVTTLCAGLPAAAPGAGAIRDRLAEVGLAFPVHARRLAEVTEAAERWTAGTTGVLLHGDLWLNNLLVRHGRLSGLIDWDTWHPNGVPGTDVFNLLAADERTRGGRDVGPLLVEGYWHSPEVLAALEPYFRDRGDIVPDRRGLAAMAVCWWASRLAGSLYRGARPTEDPAWVRRNLAEPLDWLAGLERDLG